jgi:lysine 6-dehydrogenase
MSSILPFARKTPSSLNALAKENGVTVVVDCGVAPGMSNMLVSHCHSRLDRTDSAPSFTWAGCQKSASGLMNTRRCSHRSTSLKSMFGRHFTWRTAALVKRPALSDPEYIDFPGIGTLEAFNTDGLRSLGQNASRSPI